MHLLKLYLVTMHGNVRSSKKPKFAAKLSATSQLSTHLTKKMRKPYHDVHVQRFKDSNERRDGQLLPQVIYLVNIYEAITVLYRAT